MIVNLSAIYLYIRGCTATEGVLKGARPVLPAHIPSCRHDAVTVWFLVPQIDTIFNIINSITTRVTGETLPEARLALASFVSILFPLCMF